jgi:DNA-binding transcriptional regulator YiaG
MGFTKASSDVDIGFLAFNQRMNPQRIKAIRNIYGLTQVGFAEYIGISYDTYRNWEIGHRNPSGPAIALLYIAETQPNVFRKNRKALIKNYIRVK